MLPFFDVVEALGDGTWRTRARAPATNQFGMTHGAALCLLALEVAGAAVLQATGADLAATSLSIGFMGRTTEEIVLRPLVHVDSDRALVTTTLCCGGRCCAEVHVSGHLDAGSGTSVGIEIGPGFEVGTKAEGKGAGGELRVPFRDHMGVELLERGDRSLSLRWAPSDEVRAFIVAGNRRLGLAALLVDAGGSIVNATAADPAAERYVTTSLDVSLLSGGGCRALGTGARVEELGSGRRVRFTTTRIQDASQRLLGVGRAQFVAIGR